MFPYKVVLVAFGYTTCTKMIGQKEATTDHVAYLIREELKIGDAKVAQHKVRRKRTL